MIIPVNFIWESPHPLPRIAIFNPFASERFGLLKEKAVKAIMALVDIFVVFWTSAKAEIILWSCSIYTLLVVPNHVF